MSYFFMSNIDNFDDIIEPNTSYLEVSLGDEIKFIDKNRVNQKAFFLMVRAHRDNDILIQIQPYGYGVYIPASEMWSVDSFNEIDSIIVKKIFNDSGQSINSGKLQWMIGYK